MQLFGLHEEVCHIPTSRTTPLESTDFDPGCDVWDEILNAALLFNPAFSIYRTFDIVALLGVHDHLMSFSSGRYCGTSWASPKARRFVSHLTDLRSASLEDHSS